MSSAQPASDEALAAGLAETADAIEALLASLLRDEPEAGEIHRPARLLAAMRHGALGGGKRLRPFLVAETARIFGAERPQALRAGAAVELAHCYSLVHDDLPTMDDDDLRRGRPTVHKAFDEATAILAGDSLLTLAFDVLSDPATHRDGETRAALVLMLSRALGAGGMVGGQMLDLAAEGRFPAEGAPARLGEAAILRPQAMKTGALLAASVTLGARLGQADAGSMAALTEYGRALGAAFQVADDILDVEASPEQMGKATLVTALGLEAAKRERDRFSEAAVAALAAFGAEAGMLRAAARFAASRKS